SPSSIEPGSTIFPAGRTSVIRRLLTTAAPFRKTLLGGDGQRDAQFAGDRRENERVARHAVAVEGVAELSRERLADLVDERSVGLENLCSPRVFVQGVPLPVRRERRERASLTRLRGQVDVEVEAHERTD